MSDTLIKIFGQEENPLTIYDLDKSLKEFSFKFSFKEKMTEANSWKELFNLLKSFYGDVDTIPQDRQDEICKVFYKVLLPSTTTSHVDSRNAPRLTSRYFQTRRTRLQACKSASLRSSQLHAKLSLQLTRWGVPTSNGTHSNPQQLHQHHPLRCRCRQPRPSPTVQSQHRLRTWLKTYQNHQLRLHPP